MRFSDKVAAGKTSKALITRELKGCAANYAREYNAFRQQGLGDREALTELRETHFYSDLQASILNGNSNLDGRGGTRWMDYLDLETAQTLNNVIRMAAKEQGLQYIAQPFAVAPTIQVNEETKTKAQAYITQYNILLGSGAPPATAKLYLAKSPERKALIQALDDANPSLYVGIGPIRTGIATQVNQYIAELTKERDPNLTAPSLIDELSYKRAR